MAFWEVLVDGYDYVYSGGFTFERNENASFCELPNSYVDSWCSIVAWNHRLLLGFSVDVNKSSRSWGGFREPHLAFSVPADLIFVTISNLAAIVSVLGIVISAVFVFGDVYAGS